MDNTIITPYTLDDFRAWKQDTHDLYEAQFHANQLIADAYENDLEEALFDVHSAEHQRFIAITALKAHYFKNKNNLVEEIPIWIANTTALIESALQVTDRLSIFRELVWIRLSSLPIIASYTPKPWHTPYLEKLNTIANRANSYLNSIHKDSSLSMFRTSKRESSPAFLERNRKQLFMHRFKIQRSALDKPRFIEVVESWNWSPEEQTALYLPLAVGCPNHCSMCELSTFDGGNLSPEEINHLIHLTFAYIPDAPINRQDDNLLLYFLGGGDPLLHSEFNIILSDTVERYPGSTIFVSTIGLDIGTRMQLLIQQVAKTANARFQITLGSLDDSIRQSLIRSHNRILSVEDCLTALNSFYEKSGRKGTLAFFLLENRYDDCEAILQDILSRVDASKIQLALQVLHENSLPGSQQGAPLKTYEHLCHLLQTNGYQASIHSDDLDPNNDLSCGSVDDKTIQNNEFFKKNSLIDLS